MGLNFVNFYQKFVNACNEIGKKPSAVAEEIGLSKSLVSRWKRGGGVTDATLMKVATYFGIDPEDFGETTLDDLYPEPLMNDDDDMLLALEEELEILKNAPETRSLLRSTKGLTPEQVKMVEEIMKQMRRGNAVDDS